MKAKVSLFILFCLFVIMAYGQETFCGSVRMKYSQNFILKDIKVEGRGLTNRLAEKITQKIVKKRMAPLLKTNGNYDKFVKTKGNKTAFYDTKGVSLVIHNGDEGVTYTIYPSYKVGCITKDEPAAQQTSTTVQTESPGNARITYSEPQETDAMFMGYKCKVVDIKSTADTTLLTRVWYSDDFVTDIMKNEYTGDLGSALAYSVHVDNQALSMDIYNEITEIIPGDIPDSVFEIPSDIKIVPAEKIYKYLSKKTKGKEQTPIPLTGAAMPDSFWDY